MTIRNLVQSEDLQITSFDTREEAHAEIESQVEEFLANGGEIEVIGTTLRGFTPTARDWSL